MPVLSRTFVVPALLTACLNSSVPLRASSLIPPEKPHRVHVTLVARSTSVRSRGGNQDVFLIQVKPKEGAPFFARLVDEFPFYGEPLPGFLTSADAPFSVAMRRDRTCDMPASSMFLPGHAGMADLVEPTIKEGTSGSQHPEMIPCFSAIHSTWKYLGSTEETAWWR